MFKCEPGDCLLIETNKEAGHIKSHLFVIILRCEDRTQNTIIVNIQSIRDGKYDDTIVLRKGDHPFIEHDSYINYRWAQIVSLDDLQAKMDRGIAVVKPPFDDAIFQ